MKSQSFVAGGSYALYAMLEDHKIKLLKMMVITFLTYFQQEMIKI